MVKVFQVNSGHNVMIIEQARTRKSFLVKKTFSNFIQRAISCKNVCFNGIVGVLISTDHVYYG